MSAVPRAGALTRAEVLDRLGVKDFARVAQLSAEEAFRLLLQKQEHSRQNDWARFETELTRRTAEIEQHHRDELHTLRAAEQQPAHQIQHANRGVEDSRRELAELRERNHKLESEMSKVARVGKREELSFEDEVQTWPGMCVSEKLARNGDYLLAFRGPGGAPLEPQLLIDNKDKAAITEGDIRKLVRDARERHTPVGVIVTRDETQLRQTDRECRWSQEDGIWVLRTTRQWLRRDLDVLRPLLERMRSEGTDFLQNNAALGEEIRFGKLTASAAGRRKMGFGFCVPHASGFGATSMSCARCSNGCGLKVRTSSRTMQPWGKKSAARWLIWMRWRRNSRRRRMQSMSLAG